MKILPILLMAASLPVCATGWGQNVSLRVEQAHPREVIKQLEKQTGYRFIYGSHLMEGSKPITIQADSQPLEKVLLQCFKEQPFGFEFDPPFVVLTKKLEVPKKEAQTMVNKIDIDIRGRVLDGEGQPIAGATVQVKGTSIATSTDDQGFFSLKEIAPNTILVITGAEMEDMEVSVGDKTFLNVRVTRKENTLDETIVIAYGKTSRRLNTGSVSKVTAAEISRQPVSNPILAIAGRVPGLMITPTNGLPGANTAILLRGQHSLGKGTAPLILVDGIPLTTNAERLATVSGTANQNLLNTINPADIQSIEVLKDAEATAIYGSQGANGVILISTKRGHEGRTRIELNTFTGFKNVTRTMELLNTDDYLTMRKEAFQNDQVNPTISNAPDLMVWDQERYTNWKRKLIGGTGIANNIQLSITGGTKETQILASGSYYNEKSIFRSDEPARRGTGRISFSHKSPNNKFQIHAGSSFSYDKRRSPVADLTRFIFLPPNAPSMIDSVGNLIWVPGLENPYAIQKQRFEGVVTSMISNVDFSYELSKHVRIRLSGGYNFTQAKETAKIPKVSQRPGATLFGQAKSSQGSLNSWIIEPQVIWSDNIGKWSINGIVGVSLQRRLQERLDVDGFDFPDDDFLDNMAAAGRHQVRNTKSQYRYGAIFARLKLDWDQQLLFSATLRRDGSSRFGPAAQFATFGAASAGWIFTENRVIKELFPKDLFGKIRLSYGVTGNDQIGEYQFIDSWASNPNYNYGLGVGFLPERLFNPSLQWERTRKLQVGIDINLKRNRLQFSVDHYRNRSDNQLVNYSLPTATGFSSIQRNLDALIQNSGWEFMVNAVIMKRGKFSWTSMITLSIPKNKLLKYPGLESSSDAGSYIIGEPLRVVQRFLWLGVDPATGLHQFADIDNDGSISPQFDYVKAGVLGPKYFGGIDQSITYKNLDFSFFCQFVKQTGNSYLTSLPAMPGELTNQPRLVMDRWQSQNQPGSLQRFSRGASIPTRAYRNYLTSTAVLTDASFIRVKNIALAYNLISQKRKITGLTSCKVYLQAQDLITLTGYKGADPETQSVTSLPPLKTFVAGIQITF